MSLVVNGVTTYEGQYETLAELLAAALGTASKLRLFKAALAPEKVTPRASFLAAQADFAGYAAVTLTWSAAGPDAAGNARVISNRAFFQATADTADNMIGGAWLDTETDAGPPAVNKAVRYYLFSDPVSMEVALQALSMEVMIPTPDLTGYVDVD